MRFVGLSVLKWASVSSSPSLQQGSLAWLPCCNSSSFSRLLAHIAFSFPKISLETEAFAAFSSVRSDTVGDDVMEAYQRQHPHMHLPGLMLRNCAQKFVN